MKHNTFPDEHDPGIEKKITPYDYSVIFSAVIGATTVIKTCVIYVILAML